MMMGLGNYFLLLFQKKRVLSSQKIIGNQCRNPLSLIKTDAISTDSTKEKWLQLLRKNDLIFSGERWQRLQ